MRNRPAAFLAILTLAATTAGAEVSGRVLSPDEQPVQGATVIAFGPETSDARSARILAGESRRPLVKASTGADGVFRLAAGSEAVELAVQADGFAPYFGDARDPAPRTLLLKQAQPRRGTVTAGGKAVAGAIVVWTTDGDPVPGEVLVRTGADGSYQIPDPQVWAGGLLVAHTDFAPLEVSEFTEWGPTALHSELDAGVTVEGSVVEERSGRGVSGATLWLRGWPLGRSGADGSFRILHAPTGWSSLVARTEGLAGSARVGAGRVRILMQPGRILSGFARDAASGVPIPGTLVTVQGDRSETSLTASTDARGRYAFDALPAARYQAYVTHPRYAPATAGSRSDGVLDLRKSLSLEHDFSLARLRRISGRVQDELGKPIDLALVGITLKGAPSVYTVKALFGNEEAAVRTATDGTFVMVLPAEGEMSVVVLKQGFAAGRFDPGPGEAPEGKGPVITLTRGVEVEGVVHASDGTPIPGAAVVLAEDGSFPGTPMSIASLLGRFEGDGWTTSDAEGRFKTRVHPGLHHLALRKSGHVAKVVRDFEAKAGAHADVVLEPAARLRGQVLRSDGQSIPGVQVLAQQIQMQMQLMPRASERTTATTGEDGAFAIEDLAAGFYEVWVFWAETGIRESRRVEVPASDLRIELGPTGALRGHVTDQRTGAPVGVFQLGVQASDTAERGGVAFGKQVSGTGGVFNLDDVPLGPLTLTVRAQGYVARTLDDLVVGAGADTPDVEVALEPGLTIRGRVTSEGGDPLPDVQVSVAREEEEIPSAESDDGGEYELRGLPSGSVKLEFRSEGFRTARRTANAAEGGRVDVTLSRGIAVSGVVLSDGVGVPEARVSASSSMAEADSGASTTDEKGRFRIEGLAPGRYSFEANAGDGGEAELQDVDVERASSLRLVLERPKTAVLRGRVVGLPAGEDVMSAMVVAEAEDGRSEYAAVEAAGAFRMDKAPTGRVTARASATSLAGGTRASRANELTLAPGSENETLLEFRDDFTITGTVTCDGAPVRGAFVSFDSARGGGAYRTPTDADGSYEIVGLEAAAYAVRVAGGGVSFATEYVVTGSDRFDIDATGAALSGRTVDAADGSPIAGADVALFRLGRENKPESSLTTNALGEFAARSLAEGRYRLLASKEGFGQELRDVELTRGSPAEAVFELRATDGLRVSVVDGRDGQPLDAYVVVRDTARRIVANRHSGVGADGTLRISLAPGQYLLSTSASGYGTATLPVTAPGDGLRVGLTPGGTLVVQSERDLHGRIRLVAPDGEEYVRCWCNGISDITVKGHRTSIPNITPASYAVELVEDSGNTSPAGSVAILEGQVSTLSIE